LARHQQQQDAPQALLGFYAGEFGYTIDVSPVGDPACPARIEVGVTLRLQHRVIELSKEAVANSCVYPGALAHYTRLASVDEKTVEQFSARTAAALGQSVPKLKQTYAPSANQLDSALRQDIRAIVDEAIAALPEARRDAQRVVNNTDELRQLASACSI
jgi:hypothetical protein